MTYNPPSTIPATWSEPFYNKQNWLTDNFARFARGRILAAITITNQTYKHYDPEKRGKLHKEAIQQLLNLEYLELGNYTLYNSDSNNSIIQNAYDGIGDSTEDHKFIKNAILNILRAIGQINTIAQIKNIPTKIIQKYDPDRKGILTSNNTESEDIPTPNTLRFNTVSNQPRHRGMKYCDVFTQILRTMEDKELGEYNVVINFLTKKSTSVVDWKGKKEKPGGTRKIRRKKHRKTYGKHQKKVFRKYSKKIAILYS